jgi:type IV secretory pathway VirB2 component (pilin)
MSSVRRSWIAVFYWLGVATTLACLALIVAGNTELFGRFEHRGFPLSWVAGCVAVVAFLAAEACGSISSQANEAPLPAELRQTSPIA